MNQVGRFALLVHYNMAVHIAGKHCHLAVLPDAHSLLPRKLVIALNKGSVYLDRFNGAIRDLKADGTIEKLRTKYWRTNCSLPLDACACENCV